MVVCDTFRYFLFLDLTMMIGDSSSTSVATTTTTLSADDVAEQRREVLNELSKYSYQLAELENQKYEIEQQVSTRKQCWQWGFCTRCAGNVGRWHQIYYAFRPIRYWQKSTSRFVLRSTYYFTSNSSLDKGKNTPHTVMRVFICLLLSSITLKKYNY